MVHTVGLREGCIFQTHQARRPRSTSQPGDVLSNTLPTCSTQGTCASDGPCSGFWEPGLGLVKGQLATSQRLPLFLRWDWKQLEAFLPPGHLPPHLWWLSQGLVALAQWGLEPAAAT